MGETNPKEQVQSILENLFIKIVDDGIIARVDVLRVAKIYPEGTGAREKEVDEGLERQKEDRYVSDVFG
jgi:hypothetical protein